MAHPSLANQHHSKKLLGCKRPSLKKLFLFQLLA